MTFHRARHDTSTFNVLTALPFQDTTRGRALVTSFDGHTLSFAYNTMTIEALGRTTKIRFETVLRSGTADSWEPFPYANAGLQTPVADEYAMYDEQSREIFKSFVGYVTQIIDPEDRVTRFEYQPYYRTYQGFGFPNTGSGVTLRLKNYRLSRVYEPTADYRIVYKNPSSDTIVGTTGQAWKLNNVVDTVIKGDRGGAVLRRDAYTFTYSDDEQTRLVNSSVTSTDEVTGASSMTTFSFQYWTLPSISLKIPGPRHTEATGTSKQASDITTSNVTAFAQGSSIPGTGPRSDYVILPVSSGNSVQIGTAPTGPAVGSIQTFSYATDTVLSMGDTGLTNNHGIGITRRIAVTHRASGPPTVMYRDTTDYLNLPRLDTTYMWHGWVFDKLASLANFFYYRDTLKDERVVGRTWEEVMYREPVGVLYRDSAQVTRTFPAITGIERRVVRADSGGTIVSGVSRAIDLFVWRGKPVSDTIIGEGGARRFGASYTYGRGFGESNLLMSATNGAGATRLISYSYAVCADDPLGYSCTPEVRTALTMTNIDIVDSAILPAAYYGHLYQKPSSEWNVVRKANAGGLYADSIATFAGRGFFGRVTGALDANGWYTRMDYDRNGRLEGVWLPFDFPLRGANDSIVFFGRRRLELYGMTTHHRRVDTVHYWPEYRPSFHILADTIEGPQTTSVLRDRLIAALPVTVIPRATCDAGSTVRRKDDRRLAASCNEYLPFNDYSESDGYVGRLTYVVDSTGPLAQVTAIDSAFLDVAIAAVEGEWIHLQVEIPELGVDETFVFVAGEGENPGTTRERKGGSLASGGSGVFAVEGGYRLRLNLTGDSADLRAMSPGDVLNVSLKVTSIGDGITMVGGDHSEDLRPRIDIYGEYRTQSDRADITLDYIHNDTTRFVTVVAKVDDINHTANRYDLLGTGQTARRSMIRHRLGADDRLLFSEIAIGPHSDPDRLDTIRHGYSGDGLRLRTLDQVLDSVATVYNAMGWPIRTCNSDGTWTSVDYYTADPGMLGFTDQDFYGAVMVTVTANENGTRFARYKDGLGNLRREIADSGGLKLTTRYNYDPLGRLTSVINPAGDTTRYWYKQWGQVRYKIHPDLGTVSYAHDLLGNPRISQTQGQANVGTITFNEYDDLNRIVLIGEAVIGSGGLGDSIDIGGFDPPETGARDDGKERHGLQSAPNLNRLTDQVSADTLRTDGICAILTVNETVWQTPTDSIPRFWPLDSLQIVGCDLPANGLLGDALPPDTPMLAHPVSYWYPVLAPSADLDDFEDVARYPHFPRIAISYDSLPSRSGAIWSTFPSHTRWDSLAPRGIVRNGRGREVAVAYREHGGEPYHYVVLSYDERGRVEALLRYTENLGFDAVYYRHNSLTQVTDVRVSDPLHTFRTWYGYDYNGRVDSVWTRPDRNGGLSSGGAITQPRYQDMTTERPDTAEIVYAYTQTNQVESMKYVTPDVVVDYAYNRRKWLDSLVATRGGTNIFRQILRYDSTGQITQQRWKQGAGVYDSLLYGYDAVQRLTGWGGPTSLTERDYTYDSVGNRLTNVVPDPLSGLLTTTYAYGTTGTGPNHLLSTVTKDASNTTLGSRLFSYNPDGAMTARRLRDGLGNVIRTDAMQYSYRYLTRRFVWDVGGMEKLDWRYRYSASGEREQKRLYSGPGPDGEGWVYYLLSGRTQHAVYHGMQTVACEIPTTMVYIAPVEYLGYGGGEGLVRYDPTGVRTYTVSDHLGSLRALVNDTGTVIRSVDYEPFGEVYAENGQATRREFLNLERDRESELGDHGVRRHDAELGRFICVDPLWEKYGHVSPFAYSSNNPLNIADPDGLEGIVVSGQPGPHSNKEHVLINGLDRAKAAMKRFQRGSSRYRVGQQATGFG